jgi:hypothetical protein
MHMTMNRQICWNREFTFFRLTRPLSARGESPLGAVHREGWIASNAQGGGGEA